MRGEGAYHSILLSLSHEGPEDRTWIEQALLLYREMLVNRVHFAQAAYRDAEFPWILGDTSIGHPSGEVWEPRLGEELAYTLLHPVGQWFVKFAERNPRRAAADAWLAANAPDLRWIPDRPFGRANEQGMLRPFFEAIRGRRVCVIGPPHLGSLPHELVPMDLLAGSHCDEWGSFWPVSRGGAWKEAGRFADCIDDAVNRTQQFDLFLIAAGSGAGLMIARAWPRVAGRATLIDIGATLDPYVGVYERNLVRTDRWRKEVMPLNLPEAVVP